jgi:glycosyltransferase involved in cell wall biosynthesis
VKVLHTYFTYYPDGTSGVAESIRQICAGAKSKGIESSVFALSAKPDPRFVTRAEARVGRSKSYAAPASCELGGADAFRLFGEMARGAHVVNYHFPWPFADLLHLLVRPNVATVMTWHSDIVRQKWLSRLYSPLMQRMLSSMNALVATSPTYAATSAVLSRADVESRLRVIPLGIDEGLLPAEGDERIFNRLGISSHDPFFLFVGATRYYKGLRFLVEAASDVSGTIVIAGDGSELDQIKSHAHRLPAARVVFPGRVTDAEKVALLRRCRAFVLPSHIRSEAYGMVLVEASIYGKPMVTCEIGSGTSYVNKHDETGFVVEPASPKALASALNRLLLEPRLADTMGKAARGRYERLFTGRAMGAAYADLYKELVAKKNEAGVGG